MRDPLRATTCPDHRRRGSAHPRHGRQGPGAEPEPDLDPGIDHRIEPHQPGMRDLTSSSSTATAAQKAGVDKGPVDVAEVRSRSARRSRSWWRPSASARTKINPSGGPLAGNPVMATGLIRFIEAAAVSLTARAGGPLHMPPAARACSRTSSPSWREQSHQRAVSIRRRPDQARQGPRRPVDDRPRPGGGRPRAGGRQLG